MANHEAYAGDENPSRPTTAVTILVPASVVVVVVAVIQGVALWVMTVRIDECILHAPVVDVEHHAPPREEVEIVGHRHGSRRGYRGSGDSIPSAIGSVGGVVVAVWRAVVPRDG